MYFKEKTEHNREVLSKLMIKTNDPVREDWINYIRNSNYDNNPLTKPNLFRLSLTNKMYELEQEGRTQFHLTVTYKPFSGRIYSEKDINIFFINFYTKKFLPFLLNTKNIHTNIKKSIQPISYCFVDEHETKPVKNQVFNSNTRFVQDTFMFPVRLHHHCILSVHPETLERMETLIGEDTLVRNEFSSKIMSTDLKKCESMRLLYSSKMLKQYPDFLSFPDSLKRHHRN
jgi:hypothetical protein